MSHEPLVSVLMTAYNREKYIAQAVESTLASSFTDFELIIVDDGSKDKTVDIARSYAAKDERIKVFINEKNLGDYPNRNKAAGYARGKYLKYLDSDDLIYKYGLEAFVDFMESDPEAAMGLCNRKNISTQPFPVILKPSESLRYHFFTEGFLDCAPTGTIIRRDCFERLGGFSGKRMIGDLEFGLKVATNYKVMLLPPSLSFWRNHGDQEVFIGINNNTYPALSRAVLEQHFAGLSTEVLTAAEKESILRKLSRERKLTSQKNFLKKILFSK